MLCIIKKMYNITGLVGNVTRPLANIVRGHELSQGVTAVCLHLVAS